MLCVLGKGRLQWISKENELIVVARGGLMRTYNLKNTTQCHNSHSLQSMPLQRSNLRWSHNWIVEREMSYVVTVRTAEENVML